VRLATLVLATALAVSPLQAREKSDTIVMKNGDRITCEIKGLHSDTLYIKVGYILGTLSVDWGRVDHLESKQLFLVKTLDGRVYTGALSIPKTSGERPTEIDIVEAPGKTVPLDRTQVVNVDQTATGFWQRMNGEIGTGFSYSKGNQSTQYNLDSSVDYPAERWSAGATYTSNFTSNTGATTKTRNEINLDAQRLLRWKNWYYTGLVDFLQSSVQGIQLQSTIGGGIGRYIKNTGRTTFKVYGGFAWQRINYQQALIPSPTQQVASAFVGTSLNLFRFDRTTLIVNALLLPSVSQSGRVQFSLNSSYYVKLWGKLNWNFTVYGNWDNQPPPGFVGSDYGATSGISVKFGNR
jgi:hypothetical protein